MTAVDLTLDLAPPRAALSRITELAALATVVRFGFDPLSEMQRIRAQCGPLTEICVDPHRKPRRYVLAVGASYNRRVLSDLETFHSIGAMAPGPKGSAQRRMGNGLLGPSGPTYAHYRRALQPPLRRKPVDQLAAEIGGIVDQQLDTWPLGETADLYQLSLGVVRYATLQTLFSGVQGQCGHAMLEAARIMDDHIALESSPLVRGIPRDWPGLPYRRVLRHAEQVEAALQAWSREEADENRAESLLCILANGPDENGAPGGENAVLSHLPSLFGAAFETTQATLAWTLFLIAQHPAAASTLWEELRALPDDSPETLLKSKQLDWVVRESLRLLPSVPTQTRRTSRATDLIDCELGAGTYVLISPFLTNREPEIYSEADRFKPDRWASIDPDQWQYMAFGAGPRTCIGSWFATNLLRIAVGKIMRRYRLQVIPDARIDQKVRITLRPGREGIPAAILPQDGRFEASPIRGNIRKIVRLDA